MLLDCQQLRKLLQVFRRLQLQQLALVKVLHLLLMLRRKLVGHPASGRSLLQQLQRGG